MLGRVKIAALTVAALCVASFAVAVSSPVEGLQRTANQMLGELSRNKASLKSNPRVVHSIVNRVLLPQVDQQGMARSALGRAAWSAASGSQKQRFTREFINLLIRTYSSAIAEYRNQKVEFYPVRDDFQSKRMVEVRSRIVQDGGPSIPVNYRVILIGGQWKIYDVIVEGVSMVQSFRSQFSNELNRGSMDDLLSAMAKRNLQR